MAGQYSIHSASSRIWSALRSTGFYGHVLSTTSSRQRRRDACPLHLRQRDVHLRICSTGRTRTSTHRRWIHPDLPDLHSRRHRPGNPTFNDAVDGLHRLAAAQQTIHLRQTLVRRDTAVRPGARRQPREREEHDYQPSTFIGISLLQRVSHGRHHPWYILPKNSTDDTSDSGLYLGMAAIGSGGQFHATSSATERTEHSISCQ